MCSCDHNERSTGSCLQTCDHGSLLRLLQVICIIGEIDLENQAPRVVCEDGPWGFLLALHGWSALLNYGIMDALIILRS